MEITRESSLSIRCASFCSLPSQSYRTGSIYIYIYIRIESNESRGSRWNNNDTDETFSIVKNTRVSMRCAIDKNEQLKSNVKTIGRMREREKKKIANNFFFCQLLNARQC